MIGKLSIVGTPIGNLQDLTPRAAATLGAADRIAAEDTRRTRQLLEHLGLHKPMTSYHEHNKYKAGEALLSLLEAGEHIALTTDAGMPAISDPGYELVAGAYARGIAVEVVPGPCAVSAALALSGMDASQYVFFGFLPRMGKARDIALRAVAQSALTTVLYEAPHRLRETLEALAYLTPSRLVSICNDMTKRYESVERLPLDEAAALYGEKEPRGEYALVLEGVQGLDEAPADIDPTALLQDLLSQGMSRKDAVKKASTLTDIPRNSLYQIVLELESNEDQV